MVMGDICTRACRFCAIKTSPKPPPLDPLEPKKLADAVASLGLKYIVLTSVTRDDLPDGGSSHFAECVRAVKRESPRLIVEALVPDFNCERSAMMAMIGSGADVISHNIETVERLTPFIRDRRANYRKSLGVLRSYRALSSGKTITKSGLMVGFGESEDEVKGAMNDLRASGVEILTIGQYLRPSKAVRHVPVSEYVPPETFAKYEETAYALGFRYVASGPFVRSSYRAAEPFLKRQLASRRG
jgi:lipoic acid synthetase